MLTMSSMAQNDRKTGGLTVEEKIYRSMSRIGSGGIALGIITLVCGVTVGILSIVFGSKLLKERSRIMF